MSDLTLPSGMTRRHFMGHMATTAMALPAVHFFGSLAQVHAAAKKASKSCIVLWMGGGPSHMDTWNLKPESEKNGGPFKPIDTAVPGIQISEHLPTIAKNFKHMNIIRSLNSKEGNHDRGTYMLHTGYQPNPTVVHPGFGSYMSVELGEKLQGFDLPHCIAINSPSVGAGFLGMSHSPFVVNNPTAKITNLEPPEEVAKYGNLRTGRRLAMLDTVERSFISQKRGQGGIDHQAVYKKTIAMMTSKMKDVFKLDQEPAQLRDAYGRSSFGQGCLMARRLVEAGVSYVEVSLGGWDTHANAFETLSKNLHPTLDKGMGTLLADLEQRGLINDVMVVWMGDFGRTPRINQNNGRDHWPNSWSIVIGGGGMKGGQIVGATDKDGVDITDRPIGVMDVIGTMTKTMGIDVATQYTTPRGRPIKIVDGGTPIKELVG